LESHADHAAAAAASNIMVVGGGGEYSNCVGLMHAFAQFGNSTVL